MEQVIDLIAIDSPPSLIADKIKEVLFSKASEKINSLRPEISNYMFNNFNDDGDGE